jgi:hypothetical protein
MNKGKIKKIIPVTKSMEVFESIFRTFAEHNLPELKEKDFKLTQGLFMAGALAFNNLNNSLHDSEIPLDVGAQIYGEVVQTIEELAYGNPVGISVESMIVPDSKGLH